MAGKQAKSWLAYVTASVLVVIAGIVSVLAYNSVTQSVGDSSLAVNFNLVTEPLAGRAYTPECLAECHLTYCVTPSGNSLISPIPATEEDITYTLNHAFGSDSSRIQEMGVDFLTTETYLEDVDVNGTCHGYRINEETGENESYSSDCVTNTTQEQRTRPAWKRLTSSSFPQLEAEKEQCFDVWAKVHPSLSNPLSVDVIPTVKLSDKTFAFSEAAWWNSNWSQKKEMNITGGNSSLINFTVYVVVIKENEMQTDYDDVRFLNSSENAELDFDLDWQNSTAAGFWVRFPVLQTGNNTIYMYYGNDNATAGENVLRAWDDETVEVFHFNNGSNDVYNELNSSCYIDKFGTWTTRQESAWNFGNTTVYINGSVDDTNYGTFTGCSHSSTNKNATLVFWADLEAGPGAHHIIVEWADQYAILFKQTWEPGQRHFEYRGSADVGYEASTDLSTFGTGLNSYIGVSNRSNISFYNNGSLVQRKEFTVISTYNSYRLFMDYHNKAGGNGYVTEYRFYEGEISEDWAAREWQNKNSSYVWVGSEVSLSPYAPESQGDNAIINGIALSSINTTSYTTYTDRRLYSRNITGGQATGKFDVLVSSGNQRWAFNYISSDENTSNFTYMVNITPSLYVWEAINLTSSQITPQVTAFINSTKQ